MGKSKTSKTHSSESQQKTPAASQAALPWLAHLETFATGLFATLVIWSFLDPVDATSVFEGQALAQNLGWLTCGLLCALLAKFRGGFTPSRWTWGLGLAILVFLLWSTFAAGQENSPRRGWNGFWQVASIASCLCCSALLARNLNTRTALVGLLLIGSLALSLQGLYQVSVVFPETRAAYEADPDGVIASIPGMVAPEGSPQRARLESRLYSSEPYSTFALANSLATLLSAALVLLGGVALDISLHRSWLVTGRAKLALGATVLISCIVLVCWFLTLSRTAYVGVAVGIASLLLLSFTSSVSQRIGRGKLFAAGVGFGLFFVTGLLTLWFYDSVVFQEAKKSLGYRLEYWESTSAMIQDHALTGVGLGNFQSYYPQYKLPVASEEIADPHNWIFDLAATLGVPLLLCTSLGLAFWFIGLVRATKISDPESAGANQPERLDLSARTFFIRAAVGGCLCIALLSLLKGQDLLITLLLWSVSAGLIFAAWPLLKEALKTGSQKTAAGAIAVLVCLLASGSWQASGLSIPLVVLLVSATPTANHQKQDENTSWAIVGLPALALATFVLQAWRPVNAAWAQSQQALVASSAREQANIYERAVEADPLDDTLKSRLAQIYVGQAAAGGKGEFPRLSKRAMEVLEEWLAQDSHGYPNWRLACQLAMDLSVRATDLKLPELEERFTQAAREYAESAISAYPTSVELRVQLSAIAAWTGDLAVAESELDRAIQLSETTPHQDKKLGRHRTTLPGDQQIRFPFPALPADAWIAGQPTVNAEPLIEWIRSRLNAQR